MHRFALLCLLFGACDPAVETAAETAPPAAAAPKAPAPAKAPRATPASVVGNAVDPFQGAEWLRGETDKDGLQLVVLWELWCPHCKRELPKLEGLAQEYASKGLTVSALTRLSRNVTPEDALSFAEEQGTTFPIGVTQEGVARALGARGVPAAALVKDGTVMWTGHPAQLGGGTLDQLLAAAR